MSHVELLNEGVRSGRKSHQCFDCYRPIHKGEIHRFSTCVYEGRVYTLRQHTDCANAAEFYRKFHGLGFYDFDIDGYPPLRDMIMDAGEYELDYATLRGRFPHVVCRMEFTDQIRDCA